MTLEIYNKLKTVLGTVKNADGTATYKTIRRYNSQIEHLLRENNDEIPVVLPACFIQFANVNVTNLAGQKAHVQQANFDTILHLCFPIMLNDETADLVAKQNTYAKMQVFEFSSSEPTCSRFTRTGEDPPDDESWVLVHRQKYYATLKDFSAVPAKTTGLVTTLTTTFLVPSTYYEARLSQSGTAAPTAIVSTNTMSGPGVYTRVAAGDYRFTLTGAFDVAKTVIEADPNMTCTVLDADTIKIFTTNDNNLNSSKFIIKNFN